MRWKAERDALRAALRDLRRVYDRNVDPFDACAVYDRIDALLREEKDG